MCLFIIIFVFVFFFEKELRVYLFIDWYDSSLDS